MAESKRVGDAGRVEVMPEIEDRSKVLSYETPPGPVRRSKQQMVIGALALTSLPGLLVTGLAAVDGAFNPHSDFVFEPWFVLFVVCTLCPAIWLIRRIRRRH